MADLSKAELRAIYAAGRWVGRCSWPGALRDEMRKEAGKNWRLNLVRGLATLSRELVKADLTKRRK